MNENRIRVMVVDDTSSIRYVATEQLKDVCDVLTCEDGLQAIAEIGKFRPDIVFMDIVMPKMDGSEAVALIRMNPFFYKTPILMMSSKGGVFDLARSRLLGFSGHVVKPLQSGELRQAIDQHLPGALVQ